MEVYIFIPVPVTWIKFQSSGIVGKMKQLVAFFGHLFSNPGWRHAMCIENVMETCCQSDNESADTKGMN